eukprot:CAMPEP_0180545450 /NCGR_PEP_ID=MMETSP1036_2-20121128/70044_1 /TAXON_ID=632150 /ORGANISM="Azadinium spinosum, Strain 3D9" /LENGTH=39 /DNA_ID= /DNA_START= /DNA_END= /DNA_ORIENTATION=
MPKKLEVASIQTAWDEAYPVLMPSLTLTFVPAFLVFMYK